MKPSPQKWIVKTHKDYNYHFKNIQCVEGFHIAVRVGVDGLVVYGKNGHAPNFFHMNPKNFASLEDFVGQKGEGFTPFEYGCVGLDGTVWLADCFFNPGIEADDLEEIKALLLSLSYNSKTNIDEERKGA